MRCACPHCGIWMPQGKLRCVCPECGHACAACMGMSSQALSLEDVLALAKEVQTEGTPLQKNENDD